MRAAIDDIECWYWQHQLLVSSNLCNVLVQGNFLNLGPSFADSKGNGQDSICSQLLLAPTPLILGSIKLLDHEIVNGSLLSRVLANQCRANNLVHILNSLKNTFAHVV
uniref:Uncharacterized protein n=1 Tax=Opuntia streptacantha TaxID=393608 RepID=A0A7C8Z9P9_OPUST